MPYRPEFYSPHTSQSPERANDRLRKAAVRLQKARYDRTRFPDGEDDAGGNPAPSSYDGNMAFLRKFERFCERPGMDIEFDRLRTHFDRMPFYEELDNTPHITRDALLALAMQGEIRVLKYKAHFELTWPVWERHPDPPRSRLHLGARYSDRTLKILRMNDGERFEIPSTLVTFYRQLAKRLTRDFVDEGGIWELEWTREIKSTEQQTKDPEELRKVKVAKAKVQDKFESDYYRRLREKEEVAAGLEPAQAKGAKGKQGKWELVCTKTTDAVQQKLKHLGY